jgi:RNA polymerase sigma-70 factor (ECF subfamily)
VAETGDAAAFARIALPHLDAAYSLARWLVRDPVAAEDVVQDAMLRALRHVGGFRGENARAWVLRIVRGVAFDRLAAARRATDVPFTDDDTDLLSDPAPDPEAALADKQRHATLEQALASLAPELREVIVLRELQDLSYRDIAAVAGVPIGTVMSRLWRARRALQAYAGTQR